jgi:deoxyribonuclease (pyrimidine dimer)
MTRINVVHPSELTGKHLVAEVREITRIFGLSRKCQYELHKKKIPNEYTLGTNHCVFFYDKLQYISERYDSLCNEMQNRGYNCNRIAKTDLEQGIDRSLFWDYKPTEVAMQINRDRINLRLTEAEAKKQMKKSLTSD